MQLRIRHFFLLCVLFIASFPYAFAQAWVQRGLDLEGEGAGDKNGISVALSEDGLTLATGAPYNTAAGGLIKGHVRVYDWDGNAWVQRGSDLEGEDEDELFGWSISLSPDGNAIAVGAPENNGNGTRAGNVRVFVWDSIAWVQRGMDIDGEDAFEQCGYSVGLAADARSVVMGSPLNDDLGIDAGQTRVFEWNDTVWTQKGQDIDGEMARDISGTSVSISHDGSLIAIGAPDNDGNGLNSGHARVFEWQDSLSIWVQKGLDMDGEDAEDNSGRSVSLSGDGTTLAIGSPSHDSLSNSNTGQVRVFNWDGGAWVLKGQGLTGSGFYDEFGFSCSLTTDGNRMASGGRFFNGALGPNTGQIRIFEWGGSAWNQVGLGIEGGQSNEEFATSVAISGDGTAFAGGAPKNDAAGIDAGVVRAYFWGPFVGAEAEAKEWTVECFPNPTEGRLNIRLPEGESSAHLRIMNVQGQMVAEHDIRQENEFDLELTQAPGLYLLHLETVGEKATVLKIVKR